MKKPIAPKKPHKPYEPTKSLIYKAENAKAFACNNFNDTDLNLLIEIYEHLAEGVNINDICDYYFSANDVEQYNDEIIKQTNIMLHYSKKLKEVTNIITDAIKLQHKDASQIKFYFTAGLMVGYAIDNPDSKVTSRYNKLLQKYNNQLAQYNIDMKIYNTRHELYLKELKKYNAFLENKKYQALKKELEKLEKNVNKNFILLNEERELNLYDRE